MRTPFTIGFLLCLVLLPPSRDAVAEVVLDGSVGSRGRLALNGQDIRITPDMGAIRGGNLFHSFDKFGVARGGAVTFEGPEGIDKVVGRVTGPEPSQVHGILRSTVPGAALWLLNPNGLVVGKQATIDVPGSLHLSTADELRFEDGSTFSARNPAGSTLTAAEPRAFGFLGGPIGQLSLEAPELVRDSEFSFTSLTGGAVTLDGTTIVTQGPMLIAAQASAGEIPVASTAAVPRDGTVSIRNGSQVTSYLFLPDEMLRIEGGQITIDTSGLTAVSTGSIGLEATPTIWIAGRSVHVDGGGDLAFGQISTTAAGLDRAPSIIIGGDNILFTRAAAYSLASETGSSGEVILKGERITIADGSVVGSPSTGADTPGKGGRTFIVADDALVLTMGGQILSFTEGLADAGDVVLRVGDLTVSDGSIATSSNGGTGRAGKIEIVAGGGVSVGGESTLSAFTITEAPGGSIQVTADTVDVAGRGRITTSTETSGDAGSISINARNVHLRDDALVDSLSTGAGMAGAIRIAASGEMKLDGGQVATTAAPGSGGTIMLLVGDRLILENGAGVATRIEGGASGERAGSVTITGMEGGEAGPVVLGTTAFIIADAPNVGDGGTIRIATKGLIAGPGQIDASARQGNAGTVASTAPQTDIVSSFAGLGAQVAPADRLLASSCDAREVASSLVVGAVQGGEPAFDPDRPLGSPPHDGACSR